MIDENCIFCKIIKGEIPCAKVYEDNEVLAFLDITPIKKGHTLVIPKTHVKDLLEIDRQSFENLMTAVQKVAKAVMIATGDTAFNLGANNGPASGQLVAHFHFHIIPRHEGDGLVHWKGNHYQDGEMQEYAEKIKAGLK